MMYCVDRLLRVYDLHFNNVLLKTFAYRHASVICTNFFCNFLRFDSTHVFAALYHGLTTLFLHY